MALAGLHLWWPRDGRGRHALWPRLRGGGWIFWRDLHACVAVWFSLLIVLFLFTTLPWTSFRGGRVLGPVQRALGQQPPDSRRCLRAAQWEERPACNRCSMPPTPVACTVIFRC